MPGPRRQESLERTNKENVQDEGYAETVVTLFTSKQGAMKISNEGM